MDGGGKWCESRRACSQPMDGSFVSPHALQVPPANLTDEHGTAKQPTCAAPRCPAALQKLKLKKGTVTVAPGLCDVLDGFIEDQGFKTIEKLLGAILPFAPLFHLLVRSCFLMGAMAFERNSAFLHLLPRPLDCGVSGGMHIGPFRRSCPMGAYWSLSDIHAQRRRCWSRGETM